MPAKKQKTSADNAIVTDESKNTATTRISNLAKKDQMVVDMKMQYGAAVVKLFLQQLATIRAEFEIRLGISSACKFLSGVSLEYSDQLLRLVTSDAPDKTVHVDYSIVYYYNDDVRVIQMLEADCKTKLGKALYEHGGKLMTSDWTHVDQNALYDLRFTLKREVELTAAEIDNFFAYSPVLRSVRVRARRKVQFTDLCFELHFTETWVSTTEENVMLLKDTQNADLGRHSHEIELETQANADPRVIFQHAVQLLGQGSSGVLHLTPVF